MSSPHLRAALAWNAYTTESVNFIFATEQDQAAHRKSSKSASDLVEWLSKRPNHQAARSAVMVECFSGHISKAELDDLLRTLAADGKVLVTQEGEAGNRKTNIVSLIC